MTLGHVQDMWARSWPALAFRSSCYVLGHHLRRLLHAMAEGRARYNEAGTYTRRSQRLIDGWVPPDRRQLDTAQELQPDRRQLDTAQELQLSRMPKSMEKAARCCHDAIFQSIDQLSNDRLRNTTATTYNCRTSLINHPCSRTA